MKDRRLVDDLTIEELEQILRIRKRQAREERLRRFASVGKRRIDVPLPEEIEAQHIADEVSAGTIPHESFLYGAGVRRERTRRENLLLAVELAAAGGLIALLSFAAISIRDLNREAVAAQEAEIASLPTPTETPVISAVVLPGGHTPPTSPQGAQPNYSEVPERLRPLVEQQFFSPAIAPTPGPATALRLRVPAIGLDAPIVQGDGWEELKRGVAQHLGTANPGEQGNLVLSAHNDIYGELFRDLDQLEEGDEIIVSTLNLDFTYRVIYWEIVDPTDVEVMAPTQEPVISLISCYPYLVNSNRIVVVGELVSP
jgi:sortase A